MGFRGTMSAPLAANGASGKAQQGVMRDIADAHIAGKGKVPHFLVADRKAAGAAVGGGALLAVARRNRARVRSDRNRTWG